MTNADWIELFRTVPEVDHGKLVVMLSTGAEICVDTIVRLDAQFLTVRGRVGGTIEEARGFFIPYNQMLCLRLERLVKVEELQSIVGGTAETPVPQTTTRPSELGSGYHPRVPIAPAPTDAAAASRLLVERLRASRAASPAPTRGNSQIG